MNNPTICVIGSCRVYSPTSLVIDEFPFTLGQGNTEWFTHSTRDVKQKLKILDKSIILDEKIVPLVINDMKKYFPDAHKNDFFKSIDYFVIEICSIQSNNYKGIELQQWCVRNLEEASSQANNEILSNLNRVHLTKDDILVDLEYIYSYLNRKPILLVSHNMLTKPDGALPKPRAIIRGALEEFCRGKSNVCMFDPTPHILEFGIESAMKDPAHYHKIFEPMIGRAILDKLITIDN